MARLIHGDCLEVMKDLSANSVDCFVCDLPYGCLLSDRKGKRVGPLKDPNNPNSNIIIENRPCTWDIPIDLTEFWKQVKRLAKDEHTPVLCFCTTKFGADLINSNPKWFRYELVWNKTNAVGFLSANKMPMRAHEMIYVFSKSGAYYKRVDISGNFPAGGGGRSSANFLPIAGLPNTSKTEAGRRCVTTVITMANKKTKGGHPTAKPVDLYEWLIQRYCPEGGTILDPTAGSFNSVQAALNLNRKAIGIEKDDGFFEKAEKRFGKERNEIVDASTPTATSATDDDSDSHGGSDY